MTRIDFYVLSTVDTRNRWLTACRLIEKAFRQGHKVYLQSSCEEETRALDDLLWTFRQGSFVPHEPCSGTGVGIEAPVLIGHGAAPEFMRDVLVNLSWEVPPEFDRFERLAELVDRDEAVKLAGRRRYRAYQEQGYPVNTHHLDRAD